MQRGLRRSSQRGGRRKLEEMGPCLEGNLTNLFRAMQQTTRGKAVEQRQESLRMILLLHREDIS